MITEKDLMEAIAECEGARNPSASTCIKLAAYYTILNQIGAERSGGGKEISAGYSMQALPEEPRFSHSEFSRIVERKGLVPCFPVLDEIMNALCICNPKLYNSCLQRLEEV